MVVFTAKQSFESIRSSFICLIKYLLLQPWQISTGPSFCQSSFVWKRISIDALKVSNHLHQFTGISGILNANSCYFGRFLGR